MIVLKGNILVNPELVEKALPEAIKIHKSLSETLDKDDINTVVENMARLELDLAIALGSVNENIQINEYLVKHVTSDGEVSDRQDKKTRARETASKSKVSLAKRREVARRAARTRRANPAKAKESEAKRQEARSKRSAMGVQNHEQE